MMLLFSDQVPGFNTTIKHLLGRVPMLVVGIPAFIVMAPPRSIILFGLPYLFEMIYF